MRTATISSTRNGRPVLGRPQPLILGRQPRVTRWAVRVLLVSTLVGVTAVLARLAVDYGERRFLATTPPEVSPVDIRTLFLDETPVPLTITAGWEKIPVVATRDAVRADVTLWRKMHVEDWDTVPLPLRNEALDAMVAAHRHLLASPAAWDRMTALDWDRVPQPIRAVAFTHMAEYWSGYYQVGAEHEISRRTIADTLAALLMSESWFDHRAINVNASGNRDLGVAQASDCTRERMRALYDEGIVDVRLEEEDYFDPWQGSRFAAIWLSLLLDEAAGDLPLAIRAYHRGTAWALRGEGADYLEGVERRRRRFFSPRATDGAWGELRRRDRRYVELREAGRRPAAPAGG